MNERCGLSNQDMCSNIRLKKYKAFVHHPRLLEHVSWLHCTILCLPTRWLRWHVNININIHIHVMFMSICLYVHMFMYMFMYMFICLYVYTFMYMLMHMCMYMFICLYG